MSSYLTTSTRTPFWGYRTPAEFKYVQKVFNDDMKNFAITKACYRDIFKVVVFSFENLNNESELKLVEKKIDDTSKKHSISYNIMISLYTGIYKLIKYSKRSSIKQDTIKADLLDFLKLPEEFVSDFMMVITGHRREYMEKNLSLNYPKYPVIASINWRIDVSISSSSVTRGLVPTITLKMELSDGRIKTLEMDVPMFHLIRFNVALVLKEMSDNHNRHIFKLTD
ncbi:COMM domain-containing 5 [Brachionus plicatilis]|uniref:COMM domain-containing protein 5 n=1 Tax=Brachionus plicatilis TaxID=10195 RepID=A0A3M7QI08_BRAPC|nr:COMM domain-containing 5 [Brachionus plicatilis]